MTTALVAPQIDRLQAAIETSSAHLLALQRTDGHWVGELQGDTILESEYVLLLAFLGEEQSENVRQAARYILAQQRPEGGWSNYPEGPFEISVSVKAYFALKLAGHDPDAPYMVRARQLILQHGGASACNSFTRFYLALLGQIPYASCPSVPPELVLLPRWFPINLYAMSSWTRTIVVPLSVFSACKPIRMLPQSRGIGELFVGSPSAPNPAHLRGGRFGWAGFFRTVDRLIKLVEPYLGPLRQFAMRRAVAWMRHRLRDSDGLGAIFPPMVYTIIVLRCLGVPDNDPEMIRARHLLEELILRQDDTVRLQPCFSPVWDTALTLNALAEAGLTVADAPVRQAVNWLLHREVRTPGDWSLANPRLEPGGWFFEYSNSHYPDTDDTAMVLMALARTDALAMSGVRSACERATRWLRGMQNRDGGWAAFDRDINLELLTKVPFADHNAMLDPSCPDITARVLEALAAHGARQGDPAVDRAIAFLLRTQDERGCWPGRWGVNYLYGVWQVLVGLQAIGFDMTTAPVRRAVAWLESVQQPSGAFGESPQSYDDPRTAGQGPPTASQTAWGLLALLAAGEGQSQAARTAAEYLTATQLPDGSWEEEPFTGTGFPKVFYLKYHYYRLYFPLQALARYAKSR